MTRYRRIRLTRGQSLASVAFSFMVGAGAAAATWYTTRLLLSRDALTPVRGDVEIGDAGIDADSSGAISAATPPTRLAD